MWNWNALSQQATQQNASVSSAAPPAPLLKRSAPPPPKRPVSAHSRAAAAAQPAAPHDVERFSKLRITRRTVPAEDVQAELSARRFLPLHSLDTEPRSTFTDDTMDWATIGVLTRKTLSKAAANGATFMVWSLSDLNGTELAVFLFDAAYEAHWREVEGAVVAVLNAALLPATEKNRFAFKVAHANEVVALGRAADFGICKAQTAGDARCRLAVNTAKSQYCLHHITARFLQAGKGRQQLNNSMGSFRKRVFAAGPGSEPKNISAGVYTSAAPVTSLAAANAAGWHVPGGAQKRKRADAGFQGGPMRLSTSGAVVHEASRPAAKASQPAPAAAGAPPQASAVGATESEPKRATRSQQIISSIIASSSSGQQGGVPAPLQRPKTKKVNMMHFMRSGTR
ncbi:hypothetical protein PybrP1_005663 [[Pythium] brassicae (nom. inval.)]|nr:hypothetical protein PybrP1_005663 [[Pythium] brassicae (nom. inval.)]